MKKLCSLFIVWHLDDRAISTKPPTTTPSQCKFILIASICTYVHNTLYKTCVVTNVSVHYNALASNVV